MLRRLLATYFRHAPWRFGRVTALGTYLAKCHPRPHREVVRTSFGARMDLETPDLVSGIIYATGLWEPCISHLLRSTLEPGDVFVDVGANIGYFTLLACSLVGPQGKVYSVEASPTIHARLERNVALNAFARATLVNAAASDAPGTLPMYRDTGMNQGHSTTLSGIAARDGMVFEAEVPANTLEALIGPDLYRARFVKVDVEGAEPAVFRSLEGRLDRFARTDWLVELSPEMYEGQHEIDGIFAMFQRAGYRCYELPNRYEARFHIETAWRPVLLERPPTTIADVVFTRRELGAIRAGPWPAPPHE